LSTKIDVIPQSAGRAAGAIQITRWQPHEKGSLKGFFSVTLPSGLVLRRCMLHQKGDARWIGFASREWTDGHGIRQFDPIVEFRDRGTADRFKNSILTELDEHLRRGAA
jgi:hypothetical protein